MRGFHVPGKVGMLLVRFCTSWYIMYLFFTHQAPDLDEVRESVRQGVTKVAGRLGNIANNVMASLQVQ